MKKIFFWIALPALFISGVHAQQKFTMAEATSGQWTKFRPETRNFVQWKGDDAAFTYIDNEYSALYECKESGKWEPVKFLTLQDLQAVLSASGDKALSSLKLSYFPYQYKWLDNTRMLFSASEKEGVVHFIYDTQNKKVLSSIAVPSDAAEQYISDTYENVAFTRGNNIYIIDAAGKETVVTAGDEDGIVNGSSYVHRQEFGIDRGMWWSPDGKRLAYYRKDETQVQKYPLVNTAARMAEETPIRYPMAGMTSETVSLYIYDLQSKKSTRMETGEPLDQYLTSITWEPSSQAVYIGILNRGQDHLRLKRYDAGSGKESAELFEEKASTYVEPLHPLVFVPELKNSFLYESEKNGYNYIYLVSTDGKQSKSLGSSDVVVEEYLGYNSRSGLIYYIGTANNGLDRALYAVNVKNGKTTQLSSRSGTYSVQMNPKCDRAFFSFSNTSVPSESGLIDLRNGKEQVLQTAENPYKEYDLPRMELVTVTAADGKTPLNGRIIYPSDFDASKKYPLLVYVYGGPHAQLVTNTWLGGASLWDYYMAQNGYVVFTVDNRGSDARGKVFEHIIHRQLGQNEMADQMAGVQFMSAKNFVDKERIGVYGWSFGGFMSISLMLNQASVFKVGVAGGPVCDWKWYEVMYGERYMDTPQENPEGYKKTSVVENASKLEGKLLVIHGAQDDVVVMQHSMEFINACIKNGKQVDYFLYPDHKHNVRGKDRVHLNQKIADYFDLHLKKK